MSNLPTTVSKKLQAEKKPSQVVNLQQNWGCNGLGQLSTEELMAELDQATAALTTAEALGIHDDNGQHLTEWDYWDEYMNELIKEWVSRRYLADESE